MSKASDAAQLRRLAAMPEDRIDTWDLPVVEDWSGGVRGGTPREVRLKAAATENSSADGMQNKQVSARPNRAKSKAG